MSVELLSILKAAQADRFKAQSVIDTVYAKLEAKTKNLVIEKYKDLKIQHNGIEFGFYGARVHDEAYFDKLALPDFAIKLYFVATSKLPKDKAEKVEAAKQFYKNEGYFERNDYRVKFPLWHELRYSVSFDEIIKGEINLEIDLK